MLTKRITSAIKSKLFNMSCNYVLNNYHDKSIRDDPNSFGKMVESVIQHLLMPKGSLSALGSPEPLISYSHPNECEDVELYQFLWPIKNGFYVDIGASHPVKLSVTKLFYDLGWSGINVEPRAEMMKLYKKMRPRDTNITAGVSSEDDVELPFWETGGGSTFDKKTVDDRGEKVHHSKRMIKTIRLDTLLKKYAYSMDIHFLKIDVENYLFPVLSSMDFTLFRPWVVSVEAVYFTKEKQKRFIEWEHLITDHGYVRISEKGLNFTYLAAEKKEELIANALAISPFPYINAKNLANLDTLYAPSEYLKSVR